MDPAEFDPAASVCPFCGVGCALTADPTTGKGVGLHGAVNARGELCPKGVAATEPVLAEDRLTEPLLRGDDDELHPATWGEAFDRVADAFTAARDAGGPDATFFFASSKCTNEENYLLQKVARLFGTNNVDNCARLCHSATVAAMNRRFGAGAATNTLADLRETDCILVAGANPAEQHPVAWRSSVLPAVAEGASLLHVDPRETPTTKAADVHLPVRPGYDVPLCNAMATVILDEGLVDEAFVAERTTGVDDLDAHLADLDVDAAAEQAGVDADDLRTAARLYGEADRAVVLTGMGMSQHHCGTDNVHALLNLPLLTGNLGEPGTGVMPLRGQNNVQGAGDVGALPDTLPGNGSVADAEDRARMAAEWGVEPPAEPGLTEVEATNRFGDGVDAAFVLGENPAVTEPNQSRVRERLAAVDCLVVCDLFPTETVAYADVVLPGSAWAEKAGTVTNMDRQVQRMRPMRDPPGDARLDLEIVAELGRRLTDGEFPTDPETAFRELTRVAPIYGGMSYEGIGTGSQRWPFPPGAERGTEILHVDTFATGSKTAPLVAVDHVDPPDALGDDELALTTGRVLQQYNSGALSRRSGTLLRLRGSDVCQINPADAAARGVADGDRVRVENDRGSVTVEADVTPAIREGTVFMTFHFADPLVNALTGDDLDPVAKIPPYKRSAVRVTREAGKADDGTDDADGEGER